MNMLFLFEDKHRRLDCYEVIFESNNFFHLTRLFVNKTILPSSVFYQRCLAKKAKCKVIRLV